jgi:hypothetical protein
MTHNRLAVLLANRGPGCMGYSSYGAGTSTLGLDEERHRKAREQRGDLQPFA